MTTRTGPYVKGKDGQFWLSRNAVIWAKKVGKKIGGRFGETSFWNRTPVLRHQGSCEPVNRLIRGVTATLWLGAPRIVEEAVARGGLFVSPPDAATTLPAPHTSP